MQTSTTNLISNSFEEPAQMSDDYWVEQSGMLIHLMERWNGEWINEWMDEQMGEWMDG